MAELNIQFIGDTSAGLFFLLLKMFLIVVPLMILLEVSREFKVIDMLTDLVYRPLRYFGFKRDSIYPLLAGILFGISYGGGVLIGESSAGRIKGNQRFLVAVYLGLCHAVFEDTMIFVSLGARGIIVLLSRMFLATTVVVIISFFTKERNHK
ncbi:MAG: nucleoside recognition protein [candidate division Zixibacteria bacterium]